MQQEHWVFVAPLQEPATGVLHQQSVAIVDRIAQLEGKHCIWERKAEKSRSKKRTVFLVHKNREERQSYVYGSVYSLHPLAFAYQLENMPGPLGVLIKHHLSMPDCLDKERMLTGSYQGRLRN